MDASSESFFRYCRIVIQLGLTEIDEANESRVANLFYASFDAWKAHANGPPGDRAEDILQCRTASEELMSKAGYFPEVVESSPETQAVTREEPGQWHAVLASYRLDNCEFAKSAVDVLSRELEEPVAIYRTRISGHYAVTVDLEDDRPSAQAVVHKARTIGNEAAARMANGTASPEDLQNLRYLTDAFVQQNRGWRVDPDCEAAVSPR
jgi:hypothetical protein